MPEFRVEGLRSVINTLQQLPPEIVSKRGGPIAGALRKSLNIIRDEARNNLQRIIDAPNADGRFVSTGISKPAIVVKRGRMPPQGGKGEVAIVTVRPVKYPDRKISRIDKRRGTRGRVRELQANDVLYMLEHGTEKRPPLTWMRPAFETKREESVRTFESDLDKKIAAIIRKLERQNADK